MKNPKSFYNRLKKLIEEEIPENCFVVYDEFNTRLYVIKKDAQMYNNENYWHIKSAIPGISPIKRNSTDTGYDKNKVVGSIEVEMAAVQE